MTFVLITQSNAWIRLEREGLCCQWSVTCQGFIIRPHRRTSQKHHFVVLPYFPVLIKKSFISQAFTGVRDGDKHPLDETKMTLSVHRLGDILFIPELILEFASLRFGNATHATGEPLAFYTHFIVCFIRWCRETGTEEGRG